MGRARSRPQAAAMRLAVTPREPGWRRRAWLGAGLAGAWRSSAVGLGFLQAGAQAQPQAAREPLLLRFSLRFLNPGAGALADQRLWFYLPLQRTESFSLGKVEASIPHVVETDRLGHSILYVSGLALPPYAQRTVSVSVLLEPAKPAPAAGPDTPPSAWLGPQRFIESDDAAIVAAARRLRGGDDAQTVRRIYDFVASELRYAGYVAEDLGAAYALRERRGDCTEYAALVVALCRAVGIPARMVEGYVSDRSFVPAAKDYHDWAEVRLAQRWRVVDAQKGAFLENEAAYIGFRRYSDQPVNGVQLAHRYRVEGEMEVSM